MSNPFAALFEDVDRMSDPILADTDLSDPMFAPMDPSPLASGATQAPVQQAAATAPSPARAPQPVVEPQGEIKSAVHDMLSASFSPKGPRQKAIQQALVITWDKGNVPDLMELNDLLASGWRVATTAGFPTAEGSRGSLLVVVEQAMPG